MEILCFLYFGIWDLSDKWKIWGLLQFLFIQFFLLFYFIFIFGKFQICSEDKMLVEGNTIEKRFEVV